MLIDDDAAVVTSLAFALETEGFLVKAFQRANDLIANIDRTGTGCLVLDYYLQEMTGMELLQKLRAMNVTAPVILITTNPSPQLREDAKAAGAKIIEKPLLGNALLEAIRRFVTPSGR